MLTEKDRRLISQGNRVIFDSVAQTAQCFTRTALSGNAQQEALGIGTTPSYATGMVTLLPAWYTEEELSTMAGQELQGTVPIYTRVDLRAIDFVKWNNQAFDVVAGPQSIQVGGQKIYNRYILRPTTTGGSF